MTEYGEKILGTVSGLYGAIIGHELSKYVDSPLEAIVLTTFCFLLETHFGRAVYHSKILDV